MAEGRVQRRLAAILAADVVGYSRLMGEDESGTLSALNMHRAELIHPTVAEYRGRIVKLMGDGALVEFPSVVDAVECAVAVQQGMELRNADIPASKQITFRIGINLGDIIIEGDDIYGDGVNVAARLEGEADSGGICISGDAYRQVVGKIDLAFENMGERTLKNIAQPVRTYRWPAGSDDASTETTPAKQSPPQDNPSIAVLPFDNFSNEPDQEFFSNGITEDLITDLSKMSGLFVIARNTAFSFKGQNLDIGEIGRKLGVAHVLEGSVRKAGNRVRINAQLIETASGGHVWADRFDGSLDDIFAVQDEITNKIVAALQVRLTASEAAHPRHRVTDNFEAYELYLSARSMFSRFTPEATSEARRLLEQAIAIDPDFAAAYATLSQLLQHGWSHNFPGFEDVFEQMLDVAERAVALDDTMGLTHARLGWVSIFDGRHDEAIASFERAIQLEPNAAEAYIWFGETLNYSDDPARGLEMARKSMEFDPVVPPAVPIIEGHSHFLMREYDAAIERLDYGLKLVSFPFPHILLGTVYSEIGRLEEATAQFAILRGAMPEHVLDLLVQRLPYRNEETTLRLRSAVEQTEKLT